MRTPTDTTRSYPQAPATDNDQPGERGLMNADRSTKGTHVTTIAADSETNDLLAALTQLLHHAAAQVWEQADQEPPDSPLQSLGLGVYLARSQAAELLPADHPAPDVDELDEHTTALQLLTAAEELTRALPPRVDLIATDLVINLCDLIREARDLGC